jgi:hypothetical protein
MPEFARFAESSGILLDYSQRSLPLVFEAVGARLKFSYQPFPESVPKWIAKVPEHSNGEIVFDSDSQVLIMRTSFYLGECFIRGFPSLRWATGSMKSAVANMPVVTGFLHQKEMAVLMVTRNLSMRAVCDQQPWSIVSQAVDSWTRSVASV